MSQSEEIKDILVDKRNGSQIHERSDSEDYADVEDNGDDYIPWYEIEVNELDEAVEDKDE